MLPGLNLPASLAGLLVVLRPCFTGPSFATFCGLAAGLCGLAYFRWRANEIAMRHAEPLPFPHVIPLLSLCLLALGVLVGLMIAFT